MLKSLISHKISSVVSDQKFLIIGIVLSIGSIGLLMGAVTCGTAVLLMTLGDMEMVPAMATAFFSIGFLSLLVGLLLICGSCKK